MLWIDFIKEVEKQVKESRPEIDIASLEIAYIDISYVDSPEDMDIGFSLDKLAITEE